MKQFFSIVIFSLLIGRAASADVSYIVALDTQSLGSSIAGPFSLGFELAQGDQAYGNFAVVSDFNFGTGSPLGAPVLTSGSVTGNLSGSVTLADTTLISFFAQQFSAGSALSFSIKLGANVSSGGVPDALAIYLLDSTGNAIPTTAGANSDYLFILDAAGSPNPQIFQSDTARSPVAGGSPLSVSITAVSAAPEPRTATLLAITLVCTLIYQRQRAGRRSRNTPI